VDLKDLQDAVKALESILDTVEPKFQSILTALAMAYQDVNRLSTQQIEKSHYAMTKELDNKLKEHAEIMERLEALETLMRKTMEAANGIKVSTEIAAKIPDTVVEKMEGHLQDFRRYSSELLKLPHNVTSELQATWDNIMDRKCPLQPGMNLVQCLNTLAQHVLPELNKAGKDLWEERDKIRRERVSEEDRRTYELLFKDNILGQLQEAYPLDLASLKEADLKLSPDDILKEVSAHLGNKKAAARNKALIILQFVRACTCIHRAFGGSQDALSLLSAAVQKVRITMESEWSSEIMDDEEEQFSKLDEKAKKFIQGFLPNAIRKSEDIILKEAAAFVQDKYKPSKYNLVHSELQRLSGFMRCVFDGLGRIAKGELPAAPENSDDYGSTDHDEAGSSSGSSASAAPSEIKKEEE
jgi:hypothetical protein